MVDQARCFSAEAPLHGEGYINLIGGNKFSWGWNLKTLKLVHDDDDGGNDDNENRVEPSDANGVEKRGVAYPACDDDDDDDFSVPEQFFSEFLIVIKAISSIGRSISRQREVSRSLIGRD